jgi:hypothetical protein
MQLLLDLRGYSYIPDAAFAAIQAEVARIVEIAAAAGYPLRADCVGTHPDTPEAPGTVTSCTPTSAVVGGADLTLHVLGSGFTATSKILFNGSPETTVYVSATELTTIVKSSLASAAVTVPVSVVGASSSVDFTFTLAGTQAAKAPPAR